MRNRYCISLGIVIVILGAVCSAAQGSGAQAGEKFIGTWTGTWEGAGSSGGFKLTLEKDKERKDGVVGRVSVTGEPTYKATLKTVAFDGRKMTASYDFPPEPAAEVRLACSFEGETATGTWVVVEKASGNEVINGTWTVKRKP